ncbi:polyprenyl synthetase family protein [Cohnella soli]|uniref:Polyprenyl synthetase family protein n=1 Tax=Cohnella soli TaxID=425005 RepID=A0ABW0HKC9_9BACL
MDQAFLSQMLDMADRHFQSRDMKDLMRECINEKAKEQFKWASMTTYVHGMLGGESPAIERAAALTELLMLALDIVDDVQDQDNASMIWMQRPQAYALNAVLSFIAVAMSEWREIGNADMLGEIGQLLARSIEGQQKDVSGAVVTEADYVEMVRQKSGALIRLAFRMGYSLVDGLERETTQRIDEMAECVGMIAQIGNDVNDVIRYDVKNDLLQKKRTLPILFMLVDSHEEFPPISQYYEGKISEEEFLRSKSECMQYIRDSGCIEYSQVIQRLYTERAEELLQLIPAVSPWKEKLKELTLGHV